MPYIPYNDRLDLDTNLKTPTTAGELNYNLTQIYINVESMSEVGFAVRNSIFEYMQNHDLCYQTVNDIGGALCNSLMEYIRRTLPKSLQDDSQKGKPHKLVLKGSDIKQLYRANELTGVVMTEYDYFYENVAAPYEDSKIEENGDVYPA